MTNLISLDHAVSVLEDLQSPDEVAAFMQQLGIRGERRNACACPVSIYLTIATGLAIFTSGVYIRTFSNDGPAQAVIAVPNAVASFIRKFDHGQYPDLEVGPSW